MSLINLWDSLGMRYEAVERLQRHPVFDRCVSFLTGWEHDHVATYEAHRLAYERSGSEHARLRMLGAITPVVAAEISKREHEAAVRKAQHERALVDAARYRRTRSLKDALALLGIVVTVGAVFTFLIFISHLIHHNPPLPSNYQVHQIPETRYHWSQYYWRQWWVMRHNLLFLFHHYHAYWLKHPHAWRQYINVWRQQAQQQPFGSPYGKG